MNRANASVQADGFESSPNVLTTVPVASSLDWAYQDTPDSGGGNNTYVTWLEYGGEYDWAALLYRLTPGTGISDRSDYEFFAQASAGGTGQVALGRLNDGSLTTLDRLYGQPSPSTHRSASRSSPTGTISSARSTARTRTSTTPRRGRGRARSNTASTRPTRAVQRSWVRVSDGDALVQHFDLPDPLSMTSPC